MQCYLRADGQDEFGGSKAHQYLGSPSSQMTSPLLTLEKQPEVDRHTIMQHLLLCNKGKNSRDTSDDNK